MCIDWAKIIANDQTSLLHCYLFNLSPELSIG